MTDENMTNEVEENAQEQQVPPSLGLGELGTLLQIVDLATQRGAFRGNELTQVGAIYDRLNSFLSYIQQQQEANAEEGAEEAPADAEADTGEE